MKLSILKYDPSVDKEPYFTDYDVPYSEYMTALEAFVYVDENLEPLAHDYSCRGRTCGRCSVMVDGEPCTACTKMLTDTAHIIEPLKGVPVVRDLVVDKRPMQDRIAGVATRLRAASLTFDDVIAPVDYDVSKKLDALDRCARCLVCNASCPVIDMMPGQYIGPAGMVAISLRHFDPYDESDRIAQAVQEGMWNCIMCGKCDEVCATLEIEHIATWTELRSEATKRGLTGKKEALMPFGA